MFSSILLGLGELIGVLMSVSMLGGLYCGVMMVWLMFGTTGLW